MNNNYPLADYACRDSNADIPLVQSSDNAQNQTPNGLARVRKIIRIIECSDPKLLCKISQSHKAKYLLKNFDFTNVFLLFSVE